MNHNKQDEAAILGVFAKTSYITIGTKDKPEDYGKKQPARSVYGGKHFATAPAKDGRTNDTYFEKKHNWVSDGDKYTDTLRYKESQPDKKKGFLTSDFSKRDEFSNTIRTEQWREQLGQEAKLDRKAMEQFSHTAEGIASSAAAAAGASRSPREEEFLYDAVFEKENPAFDGASRTHRDTKNKTLLSLDRHLGAQLTTHSLAYTPPTDFSKPQFARKPLVRDTFYRKTNIQYPQGCAASTGTDDDS